MEASHRNILPGQPIVDARNVLFVDDEPNFLAGLRRLLRGRRDAWNLFFAESVDEALALAARQPLDTIVTDVNMPGRDGFELLAALKADERTRDIPVIILTGNAESNLKRRGLDMGAADLLNKPVNLEDLTARVGSALRLKAYEDLLRNQNAILEEKVRERTAALAYSRQDIIWRLAKAGEFRDQDTGEHVLRVADCSGALAAALGLPHEFCEALTITSPLHDIGKIGVPDGILFKPGRLTADERNIMERHCEIGATILLERPPDHANTPPAEELPSAIDPRDTSETVELRLLAAELTLTHHERWDGTGYPRALAGSQIPISGQIVAVADVYDALRSVRAYKPAYSVAETMDIMNNMRGNHFAPAVFDAFENIVESFETIRRQHAEEDHGESQHEKSLIR